MVRAMRWMMVAGLAAATPQQGAAAAFSCGGFALLGGAQLLCSHTDPEAPSQVCNFTWSLVGPAGPTIVQGSFMLTPGLTNFSVYQGSGFSYALGNPIVLCQGRKTGG